MGFFDGRVIEFGNKIADDLLARAELVKEQWAICKDPGQSLALKITVHVMQQISEVIRESVKNE